MTRPAAALTFRPSPKAADTPARWYVATFGPEGLTVDHFANALAYGRAVKAAMAEHQAQRIDTYLCGEAKP
jgi:hypothetical protein